MSRDDVFALKRSFWRGFFLGRSCSDSATLRSCRLSLPAWLLQATFVASSPGMLLLAYMIYAFLGYFLRATR